MIDLAIKFLFGLVGAFITYALMSWMSPPQIQIEKTDSNLLAAKKCILNNTTNGTSNIMSLIDITTLSIEAVTVTKLTGNELFKKIENCTDKLTPEELKELSRSTEKKIQDRQLYKINQIIMGNWGPN